MNSTCLFHLLLLKAFETEMRLCTGHASTTTDAAAKPVILPKKMSTRKMKKSPSVLSLSMAGMFSRPFVYSHIFYILTENIFYV